MQIIWHGQSCFELVFAKGKGEHITVLIDPSDESKTGLKMPKTDAQIVLLTNKTYTAADNDVKKNNAGAFIVDGPGEYEVKGIYVRGIDSNFGKSAAVKNEENPEEKKSSRKTAVKESGRLDSVKPAADESSTIYTIEAEDMKLCSLGNLREAELNQSQVEKIGNIDILMFPVGGGNDVGAKEALKIVSQIEPSIAVPMNYRIPKLKLEAAELDDFLKAAGLGSVDPLPKLTIKKKEIGSEEAKIVVLTP